MQRALRREQIPPPTAARWGLPSLLLAMVWHYFWKNAEVMPHLSRNQQFLKRTTLFLWISVKNPEVMPDFSRNCHFFDQFQPPHLDFTQSPSCSGPPGNPRKRLQTKITLHYLWTSWFFFQRIPSNNPKGFFFFIWRNSHTRKKTKVFVRYLHTCTHCISLIQAK